MPLLHRLVVTIFLAGILAQIDTANGQPAGKSSAPAVAFTLNFPGGPLSKYIDAIREQDPEIQVYFEENVGEFSVPKIGLSKVTADDALTLLTTLGRQSAAEDRIVKQSAGKVIVLQRIQAELRFAVFNLSELINKGAKTSSLSNTRAKDSQIADILKAVELGLEMGGQNPKPNIKIHADTNLLLIKGTPRHIQVASSILSELGKTSTITSETTMGGQPSVRAKQDLASAFVRFNELMESRNFLDAKKFAEEVVAQLPDAIEAKLMLQNAQLRQHLFQEDPTGLPILPPLIGRPNEK